MHRCIELAKKGSTSPNPKVGCVILKNKRVISTGYHHKAGAEHAEIDALKKINFSAAGATMYVNLEPCCHHGRTPPCVDAIIKSDIKKVVIGMKDPNPRVKGKGIKKLKNNNVSVEVIQTGQIKKLNEFFIKYITKKMPFVAIKYAMTLDGKIATKTGDSQWISNKKCREYTHHLRDQYDAILVGINTILKDNPQLTCRIKKGKDPLRVIVDSTLKIPLNAKIVKDKNVIIATTKNNDKNKFFLLKKKRITVLEINKGKQVSLKKLMKELAKREITSVLIEGGSQIHTSAIKEKIVDKVYCFIAPKLIGSGIPPTQNLSIAKMKNALRLNNIEFENFDDNVLISGYLSQAFP